MAQNHVVGISDWKICKAPDILVTYALGSCIGTCIIDRMTGIAGLSHIMLPDSTAVMDQSGVNRMKYADTAIEDMVKKMVQMGASQARMTAKIAGGAVMFATGSDKFTIGERNIAAVKQALAKLRIPIAASEVGENFGRTVFFHTDDGRLEIKSTVSGPHFI